MEISVKVNTAEFNRWMNGVARDQVPFAMARALTRTAQDAQKDIKAELGSSFTLRNAHTARGIRITRAEKKDGFRMKSEVGSIDWYVKDQVDDRDSTRQPKAAKYRYIPKGARSGKKGRIPKRLKPAALTTLENVFWKPKADGTALVYQRMGKTGSRLKLLYVAVPKQRIRPGFSFASKVRQTANRTLRRNLIRSMQSAIKSAK